MSEQEVFLATEKNMLDDNMDSYKELVEFEQMEKEVFNEGIVERLQVIQTEKSDQGNIVTVSAEEDLADSHLETTGLNIVFCYNCGEELHPEYVAMFEDEKITRLKHLLDSQETGVEISYRCIQIARMQKM